MIREGNYIRAKEKRLIQGYCLLAYETVELLIQLPKLRRKHFLPTGSSEMAFI